ncbi:FAD-binding oxidoreductase [Streptomyces sp. TRM68367]|uniref:FAD-binding oxidoreductase n=1 Tax=Streptomyces sp. TRM68367 TaxID=2758415 RepID=UPI00165A37E0|nr:FAD-binding oxidoreductase [Streptomyces sp. TRM68367]MBC9724462.1 FAD-binding oxidoreductase [Streptomyces sp. TRM68367]
MNFVDNTTDLPGLPVLRPGDPGYDERLTGFQTGFAPRPGVVVAASGAQDVVAAVRYAARADLPVDVQATGHGRPGPAEGGVLITTRDMDTVRVDPGARTVRVEAGVRWGQVVAAAEQYGLAPLNGSSPGVGAVSYTLGGGLGILGREFGYAADHVRSLDVVTADGRLRHVTPDAELYWALLGAGHAFGVVTALEIGLVPVTRLYGGAVSFDGREVEPAAVLRAYEEWTRTVPDGLTSSFAAVPYPDTPGLPPHLRGRYVISVHVAYTGADGERITAPLREIGPVLADSLRVMPYGESHTVHSDPDVPHAYYGDNAVLSELDLTGAAELLSCTAPDAGGPMCVVSVAHLGGALARPAPNAVPHRDGRFMARVLTVADRGTASRITDRALAPLAPVTLGRSLNFVLGAGERTEGLYDSRTRERLAGLKSQYDPASLFRRNYPLITAGTTR